MNGYLVIFLLLVYLVTLFYRKKSIVIYATNILSKEVLVLLFILSTFINDIESLSNALLNEGLSNLSFNSAVSIFAILLVIMDLGNSINEFVEFNKELKKAPSI